MNILFVCSMNQWRSPSAVEVFKSTPGIQVRSAGVSSAAKHQINEEDIRWAKHIFVMEKAHKERIIEMFPSETVPPIHNLEIGDDFPFMHRDLIEIFETEVREQIEELLKG